MRYSPAKPAVIALAVLLSLTSLTACSTQRTTSSGSTSSSSKIEQSYNQNGQHKTPSSLAEVKPTFSQTRWKGVEYTKIDEESLLEIIRIAMNDAKKMYIDMGAGNMTIKSDGTASKDSKDFYPSWMNEYFFLARAKRESGNYMIDYVGEPVDDKGNRAIGIMCVVPEYIIPTLNQYMRDTFKSDMRFDDMKLQPSASDLKNYKTSKQSANNLKESVYDMVFTSICYDIYNAKCLGPNHKDYYAKFGGYDENLRQQVVTALYLFRRADVISSLRNGTFYEKFGNTDYVQDILNFQKQFKNEYSNNNQPEK